MAVLPWVLGGVGALLAAIYYYFTSTFGYWRRKGVPYAEPEPFFGNMRDMTLLRSSQAETLQDLYHRFEDHPFVGVFVSRRPSVLLRDPEYVKHFLVRDFQHFQHRDLKLDEKRDPLTANLFTLGGPRWRVLRTKLTPTFTSGKMKMMFHLMEECAGKLVASLEPQVVHGEEIEMKEVLAKYATDVIGSCAFGLQINSLTDPESEFRKMGRKMFAPSLATTMRRFVLVGLPALAKVLNVSIIGKDVTRFFSTAVKETVEYREKHGVLRNDFLQMLMQLKRRGGDAAKGGDSKAGHGDKHKDDFELTDNLLAAQVFVFFMAGFETTSTTMSFALHELAANPDVQTRLREEVDRVLQEHGGKLSYDAVMSMDYLDKVVMETLRKWPPVSTLVRQCTRSYAVPNSAVTLDKGTRVLVPVYALHRDPRYYPEPERFDPERFSAAARAARPACTFLPFGEGPRICIGMRFGLVQTKAGLAALLSRYTFGPCARTEEPPRLDPKSLVTASAAGAWLRVSPR